MLLSNTLRYGLARGVSGLLNFLALALFTRLLGREGYGHYALAIASVGLGYAVLYQWLSLATLRLLNTDLAPRPVFQRAVIGSYLKVSTAVLVGATVALLAGPPGWPRPTIVLCALLLVVQAWHEINLMLASADSNPLRYGMMTAGRALGSLLVGGALAFLGLGFTGVLAGACIGFLVPGLWAAKSAWIWSARGPDPGALEGSLLRYGAPLVITYLLDFVISSSDRLLIGALRGPGPAGTYAAAYDLAQQPIWTLMMVVNLAAYPLAVAAIDSGDRQAFEAHGRRHLGMLLMVCLPVAAGLWVLAPGITLLVLGGAFADESAGLLPIIALAVVLGGLKAYYFDLSFQLGRSTIHQVRVVLVAALVNLLLNLLLIPTLGARGAALATLCAYAVSLALSIALGRRVLRLPIPVMDVVRILGATAGMVAALWWFRDRHGAVALLAQVIGGALLFGALLLALNPVGLRSWLHGRRPSPS